MDRHACSPPMKYKGSTPHHVDGVMRRIGFVPDEYKEFAIWVCPACRTRWQARFGGAMMWREMWLKEPIPKQPVYHLG